MEVLIYFLIFMMGAFMGSFASLAIYRIPIGQDIFIKHSYCPNCNAKLTILDLIPVFSYLLIGGKCRHCHKKIRIRYLLLEVLSGLAFLTFIISMKLDLMEITKLDLLTIIFGTIYIITLILIAGIDKENRKMDKFVSIYGIVISILYMVYLCIVEQANIYRYGIYLTFYIIVLILDTITLKKYAKNSYVTGILLNLITMVIFTGEYITIISIIMTVLVILIDIIIKRLKQSENIIFFYLLMEKIKLRKRKSKKTDGIINNSLSIGFFLGIFNILMLILVLFVTNYRGVWNIWM